jgi:hypothetical protein
VWQQIFAVPDFPVKNAFAKDVFILDRHGDPDNGPVPNQTQPVDEDIEE